MNLISCNNCGVVLDKDQIKIPSVDDIADEHGDIITHKAIWTGYDWVPTFPCPVCKNDLH